MRDVRQALTGILAALISAVIILGSIVLALTETGQKIARLPETSPPQLTPMPPITTSQPGEPTFTVAPTRLPQMPTAGATYSCPIYPGWQILEVFAGDTWESLARSNSISIDELLQGNCLDPGKIKRFPLMPGMAIYVPQSKPIQEVMPTGTITPTPTRSPEPPKEKSGHSKPKATPCGPPSSWTRYLVRSGDNLSRISLATGTTVARLRNANCLASTLIRTGQWLWVPRLPVVTAVRSATPRPPRTATLTLTSPPSAVPTDTVAPTETQRPTSPPPIDTPVPSQIPLPTPYP